MTELAPGTYGFTTASGTTYLLSIGTESSTLARCPGTFPMHPSMDGGEIQPMRRDRAPIPVIAVQQLAIGHPAFFTLNLRGDGIHTLRRTSEVLTLDPISID